MEDMKKICRRGGGLKNNLCIAAQHHKKSTLSELTLLCFLVLTEHRK